MESVESSLHQPGIQTWAAILLGIGLFLGFGFSADFGATWLEALFWLASIALTGKIVSDRDGSVAPWVIAALFLGPLAVLGAALSLRGKKN